MASLGEIPKSDFLNRMKLPAGGSLLISMMLVGLIANAPWLHNAQGPSALDPFWVSAWKLYGQFLSLFGKIPQVCWTASWVNDFQKGQCENFWGQLIQLGSLTLAPFGMVGVGIYFALEQVNLFYKKAQKLIKKGQASGLGVVTDPPEAARDVFSWFYCLQPLTIQRTDRSQITVYFPLDTPLPQPGQTLVLYEVGRFFGSKRNLALQYTPHISVVRGG